jgi:hypothetical protein
MSKNYLWNEGETPQQFAERLQKQLDEYKSQVANIKTKEGLDDEEKLCNDELDKYEAYLKETAYVLAESVDYDGTHFTKRDITTAILYFLNKVEVKWDYTLGLYELSKLWRNNIEQITFHQMDSTLRTLDQVQFKGYKEWKDILAINEFFKNNNDEFSIDTAGLIYLHQRHNAVMDQQELIKTIDSHNAEVAAKEKAGIETEKKPAAKKTTTRKKKTETAE